MLMIESFLRMMNLRARFGGMGARVKVFRSMILMYYLESMGSVLNIAPFKSLTPCDCFY